MAEGCDGYSVIKFVRLAVYLLASDLTYST